MDVWQPEKELDLNDFFNEEEKSEDDKIQKPTIVLEYTQEDHDMLIEILNKQSGSKEKIIYDLIVSKL